MSTNQLIYLVFSGVILIALLLDLGLLSKKNSVVSLKMALVQTIFWVTLSLAFCGFVWYENGRTDAVRYISAYLLEWSLSIDNIFVFIIIFSFFKVKPVNYSRVLLMGILMAIVFRIIFITVGSGLVARFSWIMYIFGAFLVFTGFKMFTAKEEQSFDPENNWAFKFMKKENIDEAARGRTRKFLMGRTHEELTQNMKYAPEWIRGLVLEIMEGPFK